ncbi:MAG: tetratricopeptide repeat protein [Sulfurovaceae bacterium]|nr:tetratricopeptide repeat protein [Sulfurovaceae bacterium]MDD5549306.1 tetratricopeptide repeat protein [Sulfurovaceae bacterium]
MKKIILMIFMGFSFLNSATIDDGMAYYNKGNYNKAFETFYILAKDNNDTKAQYNTALMFLKGQGVNKSRKDALYWYTKAANQNHAPSQYTLGYLYQKDAKASPILIKQAKYWYERAMKNNFREAYTNMAFLYYNGYGKMIPKNTRKAIILFSKAAAMGDSNAQLNLGIIYGWSDEVLKNKLKSYDYLKQALQNGRGEAGGYLDILCKESSWICR